MLYPTTLLGIAGVRDLDVAVAQCRAYNDWLADFCSAPDRLFGIAIIPQQDVEAAAEEIRRASKVPNLVGTFIRPNPVVEWRHFHDPVYDPMWQAASDAGWPIGLHPYLAADVPGAVEGLRLNEVQSEASILRYQPRMNIRNIFYTQAIGNPVDMMTSLAFLLAGGVCERLLDLRFIVLETNGGWITPWMERLDHNAKTFPWTCPTASCRRPSTSGASATSASTPTKRRWRSPPSRRTWGRTASSGRPTTRTPTPSSQARSTSCSRTSGNWAPRPSRTSPGATQRLYRLP